LLNGALIGWLGLIIDPNWPLSTKFIIPFFIAGMTAGALSSSSSSLMSYYCFISPILLMLSYGLFRIDMQFAAFLVIVYILLMFATSKKINATVVEGMMLRI